MFALLKALLARWALFKLLLKSFGSLAWLIPIAMLLKALGWPVLLALGVLAIPLVIVLAIVGLPLLLVAASAGIMLMITWWLITTAVLLAKIAIPVLLVLWVLRWLRRGNGKRGGGAAEPPPAPPRAADAGTMPESGTTPS